MPGPVLRAAPKSPCGRGASVRLGCVLRLLPDVVRVRDLPAAAWLTSAAFVQRRWRSKALMVLAWPVYLLTLMPPVLLGGAYWRERNGLVLVHPRRRIADFAVVLAALVAVMVGGILLLSVWVWLLPVALVGGAWFYAGVVIALLCNGNGSGSAMTHVGRGTPPGRRWIIGGLAQRPGTHLTAVLLARDLVRVLPRGSVLLAVAADDELLRRYLRLGFTEDRKRRVHLRIP